MASPDFDLLHAAASSGIESLHSLVSLLSSSSSALSDHQQQQQHPQQQQKQQFLAMDNTLSQFKHLISLLPSTTSGHARFRRPASCGHSLRPPSLSSLQELLASSKSGDEIVDSRSLISKSGDEILNPRSLISKSGDEILHRRSLVSKSGDEILHPRSLISKSGDDQFVDSCRSFSKSGDGFSVDDQRTQTSQNPNYAKGSMQFDLNEPPSVRESSDAECSTNFSVSANPNSLSDDLAVSTSGSNHLIDLNMEASQYSVNSNASAINSPFKLFMSESLQHQDAGSSGHGYFSGVSSVISRNSQLNGSSMSCTEVHPSGSTFHNTQTRFLNGSGCEAASISLRANDAGLAHAEMALSTKVTPLNFGRNDQGSIISSKLTESGGFVNNYISCDGGLSTDYTDEESGLAGPNDDHSRFSFTRMVNHGADVQELKSETPSKIKTNGVLCKSGGPVNDKALSSCVTSEVSFPSTNHGNFAGFVQAYPLAYSTGANSLKRKSSKSESSCHCAKRKKSKNKVVKMVPAISDKIAEIPSDDHSWRKYGQKPIKGSPYPRGYYKCSGVKGCPAKKHVERCLNDPAMLIVTYEGEHNHPRQTSFEGPNTKLVEC